MAFCLTRKIASIICTFSKKKKKKTFTTLVTIQLINARFFFLSFSLLSKKKFLFKNVIVLIIVKYIINALHTKSSSTLMGIVIAKKNIKDN